MVVKSLQNTVLKQVTGETKDPKESVGWGGMVWSKVGRKSPASTPVSSSRSKTWLGLSTFNSSILWIWQPDILFQTAERPKQIYCIGTI